jgi:hypothetical protein
VIGAPVNLVPAQYRSVSVADIPVPLDELSVRGYLLGRPAYRRTRYLVARHGTASAVLEVSKESEQPLFSPITAVALVAAAEETAFVDAPEADTAIPSQLARVAAERAPQARCVIVRGRYGHVSFIADPAPARVTVVEVVPPRPAKLVDQLSRVLDLAEDLPPVDLVPDLVDLAELAASRPSGHYLFPCRAGGSVAETLDAVGSGTDGPGAGPGVSYLDEVPRRRPWTLVGCARSRAIHDFFYGGEVDVVDMCPRALAVHRRASRPGPVLTKCCLLEDRVSAEGDCVVVPWGATFAQVKEGLQLALQAYGPPRHDRC